MTDQEIIQTEYMIRNMSPEEFEDLPLSSRMAIAQYLGRNRLFTLMRLMGE